MILPSYRLSNRRETCASCRKPYARGIAAIFCSVVLTSLYLLYLVHDKDSKISNQFTSISSYTESLDQATKSAVATGFRVTDVSHKTTVHNPSISTQKSDHFYKIVFSDPFNYPLFTASSTPYIPIAPSSKEGCNNIQWTGFQLIFLVRMIKENTLELSTDEILESLNRLRQADFGGAKANIKFICSSGISQKLFEAKILPKIDWISGDVSVEDYRALNQTLTKRLQQDVSRMTTPLSKFSGFIQRYPWLGAWYSLSTSTSGECQAKIPVILDPSVQLEPFIFRWLTVVYSAYSDRDDVAGFDLVATPYCHQSEQRSTAEVRTSTTFHSKKTSLCLLQSTGSFAFAPSWRSWHRFVRWFVVMHLGSQGPPSSMLREPNDLQDLTLMNSDVMWSWKEWFTRYSVSFDQYSVSYVDILSLLADGAQTKGHDIDVSANDMINTNRNEISRDTGGKPSSDYTIDDHPVISSSEEILKRLPRLLRRYDALGMTVQPIIPQIINPAHIIAQLGGLSAVDTIGLTFLNAEHIPLALNFLCHLDKLFSNSATMAMRLPSFLWVITDENAYQPLYNEILRQQSTWQHPVNHYIVRVYPKRKNPTGNIDPINTLDDSLKEKLLQQLQDASIIDPSLFLSLSIRPSSRKNIFQKLQQTKLVCGFLHLGINVFQFQVDNVWLRDPTLLVQQRMRGTVVDILVNLINGPSFSERISWSKSTVYSQRLWEDICRALYLGALDAMQNLRLDDDGETTMSWLTELLLIYRKQYRQSNPIKLSQVTESLIASRPGDIDNDIKDARQQPLIVHFDDSLTLEDKIQEARDHKYWLLSNDETSCTQYHSQRLL